MDVSYYISELLKKNGEINVPGLGFLVQGHVPGHYNEAEGKFYPPHHQVQFDPQQLDDDDSLTEYIAAQKNISLASSKYFTEKFIAGIREDALVKEVQVADLGWFYTEQGKLLFRPAEGNMDDPAFFGLQPVNITKIGQAPVEAPTEPGRAVFTGGVNPINAGTQQPKPHAEPIFPIFQLTEETAEEEEEYEEEHRRPVIPIVILGVVLVLALGVFGMYKYAPNKYNAAKTWVQNMIGKKQPPPLPAKPKPAAPKKQAVVVMPAAGDTVNTDSMKKAGNAAKTATAPSTQNKLPDNTVKQGKDDKALQAAAQKTLAEQAAKKKIEDAAVRKKFKQDSIAKAKQDKIDAALKAKTDAAAKKKAHQDSIAAVRQAKTDADKKAKADKALAAAAKKTNTVAAATPGQITAAPVTQRAATKVVSTKPAGSLPRVEVDPNKTWFSVMPGYNSEAAAQAAISDLKKKGIDAFVVANSKSTKIWVALGTAYSSNDEADAATKEFKNKGASKAYITQINPKK